MKNLKLSVKLQGALAGVLIVFAMVGAVTLVQIADVSRFATEIKTDHFPGAVVAGELRAHATDNYLTVRALLSTIDAQERAAMASRIEDVNAQVVKAIDRYQGTISVDEDRRLFGRVTDARKEWVGTRARLLGLSQKGAMAEALAQFKSEGVPQATAYIAAAEALVDYNVKRGTATNEAIMKSVERLHTGLLAGFVIAVLFGVVVVRSVVLGIVKPIGLVIDHAGRVGQGDLLSRCDYQSGDEIGQLASAINEMTEGLRTGRAEAAAHAEQERQQAAELAAKVTVLLTVVRQMSQGDLAQMVTVMGSDSIGQLGEGMQRLLQDLSANMAQIARNANTLAASSEQMSATSQQMSANSEETSSQASVVSEAAEQVSRNVQSVATATEEMTSSIKEISRNAQDATRVASAAVEVAASAGTMIEKLGDSSAEIGKVVKVITSIAEQTNLLALNATIEAARAGEAGKGFAVVAHEVKELAKETAKATEDIGSKIDAIQRDTSDVVKAIDQISKIIAQVNDISTTIASAVEEQTATTNEIGRSVADAAQGMTDIARNIGGVAQAAQSTAAGASESLVASSSLSQMALELQELVSRFRLAESAMREGGHRSGPLAVHGHHERQPASTYRSLS